ncbi:MAG: 30S ribosomal protein S3 [Betaproteobacteria bacterium]|nr:MAG: 30S ribosomal protein S3 [Betaproteobacteria bacterium]TMH90384.1 MAG: 30S ribosomal protein S3 [Betaproteobacteria bacterium]
MGQKIHPIGFRLSVNKNWSSRWYANSKNFATMLNEDLKVRDYLKKRLSHASVGKVMIERPAKDARITIHSARPGVVIGKKGEDIEMLKADLRKLLGVQMVHVNIEEIRKPEVDAQLIADSIAQQLEKRIMFRRAMKRAMQNAMRLGAQGIKIMSAGRLNGIEIARTEWYREGRVPLHTLRAEIDYGFSEAKTTYGVIGIKCWVYKGEVMAKGDQPVAPPAPTGDEVLAAKKVKKATPRPAPIAAEEKPEPVAAVKAAADAGSPAAAKPRARPQPVAAKKAGDAKAKAEAKPKTAVKKSRKPKTS